MRRQTIRCETKVCHHQLYISYNPGLTTTGINNISAHYNRTTSNNVNTTNTQTCMGCITNNNWKLEHEQVES